jgi:hypothetical protein
MIKIPKPKYVGVPVLYCPDGNKKIVSRISIRVECIGSPKQRTFITYWHSDGDDTEMGLPEECLSDDRHNLKPVDWYKNNLSDYTSHKPLIKLMPKYKIDDFVQLIESKTEFGFRIKSIDILIRKVEWPVGEVTILYGSSSPSRRLSGSESFTMYPQEILRKSIPNNNPIISNPKNQIKMNEKKPNASQTLGQKRVKAEFNPAKNDLVDQIKNKTAELIDLLESMRVAGTTAQQTHAEKHRVISIAQTEFEGACHFAVKACFTD